MVFAKAELAPKPRTETAKQVAWVYAGVLVLMAIAQLFSFEKFIPIIEQYNLVGGESTATLVASLIVVTEVFALPFLLRMPLSRLMRLCSLGFAALVPVIWAVLALVSIVAGIDTTNSGVLGEKVFLPTGFAQILWVIGLSGLAAWSIYGLWPLPKK